MSFNGNNILDEKKFNVLIQTNKMSGSVWQFSYKLGVSKVFFMSFINGIFRKKLSYIYHRLIVCPIFDIK